jgi:hypothetical protein
LKVASRISLLAIGLASLLGAGTASAGALVEFPDLSGMLGNFMVPAVRVVMTS